VKELVEYLVTALVDHTEEVSVKETDAASTVIYEIRCDQRDVRILVGKKGRMINALRTIVSGVAGKLKRKAQVDIIEEEAYRKPIAVWAETDSTR
jgi:predicted RNA-binding protein YlqC (UPF0109 family)